MRSSQPQLPGSVGQCHICSSFVIISFYFYLFHAAVVPQLQYAMTKLEGICCGHVVRCHVVLRCYMNINDEDAKSAGEGNAEVLKDWPNSNEWAKPWKFPQR